MRILHAIRVALSWREVWKTNHWSYQTNAITGVRRFERILQPRGFMSEPPDFGWVETGERTPIAPPVGGGGAMPRPTR